MIVGLCDKTRYPKDPKGSEAKDGETTDELCTLGNTSPYDVRCSFRMEAEKGHPKAYGLQSLTGREQYSYFHSFIFVLDIFTMIVVAR